MINVVLIDLDGTLVDSVAGIHLACSDMASGRLKIESFGEIPLPGPSCVKC